MRGLFSPQEDIWKCLRFLERKGEPGNTAGLKSLKYFLPYNLKFENVLSLSFELTERGRLFPPPAGFLAAWLLGESLASAEEPGPGVLGSLLTVLQPTMLTPSRREASPQIPDFSPTDGVIPE